MPRDTAYRRALRTLGTSVLAVFLFGLTSAPLRPCFSHPGHTSGHPSGSHAASSAPGHGASHHASATPGQAPSSEHEGCSCLGHCSLEHAPYLSGAELPSVAEAPNAPKALIAHRGRLYAKLDQFRVPLARPPPSVV